MPNITKNKKTFDVHLKNKECVFCGSNTELVNYGSILSFDCLKCDKLFTILLDIDDGSILLYAFSIFINSKVLRVFNHVKDNQTIFSIKGEGANWYEPYDQCDLIKWKSFEQAERVAKLRMVCV